MTLEELKNYEAHYNHYATLPVEVMRELFVMAEAQIGTATPAVKLEAGDVFGSTEVLKPARRKKGE